MTIQRHHTNKRMSQIVIHGDTVYLAGQVALDKPGGSFAEQTQNILDRIDALLKEAGSDKSKLLSATIWLSDMRGFEDMNAVWDAWLPEGCAPGPGHRRGQARHAGLHGRDRRHRGEVAAMRVAVLGAGVIGVATAYELWRDGHEVVVLDRAAEPASGTSFANAGMIAPGHAYAWSSPKALRTLARALFRDDLALRFRFQADPRFWSLVLAVLPPVHARARRRQHAPQGGLVPLQPGPAARGRGRHRRRATVPAPAVPSTSTATPAGLAQAAAKAQILRDEGVEVRAVTPDEAAALDPVYEPVRDRFAGALYAPGDESGDARLFTRGLADWLAARGVEFRFGEAITEIAAGPIASPRSSPTRARSGPMPSSWRWAAGAPRSAGRSGSTCRSTRSRATR